MLKYLYNIKSLDIKMKNDMIGVIGEDVCKILLKRLLNWYLRDKNN